MMQPMPGVTSKGRPREFDPDEAIERAMGVFWSNGYRGTSLPDLMKATKLSRGSLYAAFGDKHGLFLRALDRYIADFLVRFDEALGSADGAFAGLRLWLDGYADRTSGASGKRGCLVVATAMELVAQDREVASRIRRFFVVMQERLMKVLQRAESDLADGMSPERAARVLLCYVEGMRVVGKTGVDRADAQAASAALLASLFANGRRTVATSDAPAAELAD